MRNINISILIKSGIEVDKAFINQLYSMGSINDMSISVNLFGTQEIESYLNLTNDNGFDFNSFTHIDEEESFLERARLIAIQNKDGYLFITSDKVSYPSDVLGKLIENRLLVVSPLISDGISFGLKKAIGIPDVEEIEMIDIDDSSFINGKVKSCSMSRPYGILFDAFILNRLNFSSDSATDYYNLNDEQIICNEINRNNLKWMIDTSLLANIYA